MARRHAVIRKHAIVRGVVQGIGYRYAARAEAFARGLSGFARNLPDGAVELEMEGDETSVADMLDWLRHGPPDAVVESVEATDVATIGDSGFSIRR